MRKRVEQFPVEEAVNVLSSVRLLNTARLNTDPEARNSKGPIRLARPVVRAPRVPSIRRGPPWENICPGHQVVPLGGFPTVGTVRTR